jgi:deoxyribodipyrimidine photo-lyase
VVLEGLRCDHPWASRRFHRFVLEGMASQREAFRGTPVLYHPYVERSVGEGRGLLEALARHAALIVADDAPGFFLPAMVTAAAARVPCPVEAVDVDGLLPLSVPGGPFTTAHSFRRHLQKNLRPHLEAMPVKDPLKAPGLVPLRSLPSAILRRWPAATDDLLAATPGALAALPIDASVDGTPLRGGADEAERVLRDFVATGLPRYDELRNHPDDDAASGLSPWLHFGHIGVHRIFDAVARREEWSVSRLAPKATGSREGWWGMSRPAEALLDELVTWRELGRFEAHRRPLLYARYEGLPAWARATLEEHVDDARAPLLSLDDLAASRSPDPIWNAAQRQLREEGRMPNYLRMLWGKRVLEWTRHPREAFDTLVELNNRYAIDGRDPNSWTGISWVLGKYDRPWAPEREVFGRVRCMTSGSTKRKLHMRRWMERWGEEPR